MTFNRQICIMMAIALVLSANAGAHSFASTTAPIIQYIDTHQDVDLQDSFSLSNGFTQNIGQFGDPSVLFYASGPQGSIAFEENSILLNIKEPTSGGPKRVGEDPIWGDEIPFPWLRSSRDAVTYGSTVRLSFDGADGVAPEGRTRLPEYRNYFLGNDPTLWSTRVPSYREVVYEDIYQGIDLVYREEGKQVRSR